MPDGERGKPSEKRQVEGNGVGETFIRLQGKLQTYQKLITETGLAKTDLTHSTASTRSLQMVLEAKWVKRGSDWPDPDYPRIYKLWAF